MKARDSRPEPSEFRETLAILSHESRTNATAAGGVVMRRGDERFEKRRLATSGVSVGGRITPTGSDDFVSAGIL